MRAIHEFNAAANRCLADYASQVRCLRRNIESRVTAVQEAVAHSQALMVKADALIAEVTRECGLWPAYRSAHGEPKSGAQWRDSAHEAFVRAEAMRDADAGPDDA
jgi:hypothetical protein